MIIIGVTGSMGTGKTTVAGMLASLGAEIIDADKLAHCLIKPGTREYKKIISLFGRDILAQDESIDREKLADLVFSDQGLLRELCAIVHPGVIEEIKRSIRQIAENSPDKTVVIDAPLLIEAGLAGIVDKLIVVEANLDNQLLRCGKQTDFSEVQIKKRIKNQLPLAEKIKLADYVIDNNKTLEETLKQVREIWQKITTN